MSTEEKPEATANEGDSPKGTASPTDQADWTWAEPKSLKVKPEFQRLIPLQARGELLAMDESIKTEGCRDPLLVWAGRGVVLDGHTRRDLCIKHKRQVKVREIDLPDEKAAAAFILQLQRQRRNLTREALSYFRGTEYNALKQQRGGDRSGAQAIGQSDRLPPTATQLAEKHGVSEKTIRRDGAFAQVIDRLVADHGDPEIKRKLLGADVRLTPGLARLLLKKPAGARKAALEELVAKGAMPRAKKGGTAPRRKPKEVAQTLTTQLRANGNEHARAVFKQMARLLGFEVTEKSSDH